MSNVNHPTHYTAGKIEVIEAIEDWKLGYHLGNAVKYIARAGKKDPSKFIEDLEKARWYLSRAIELETAKRDGRDLVRPNDMNARPNEVCKHPSHLLRNTRNGMNQITGTQCSGCGVAV